MKRKQVMYLLLAGMMGAGSVSAGTSALNSTNLVYAAESEETQEETEQNTSDTIDNEVVFPEYYPDDALTIDSEDIISQKISAVLNALTQEEKFSFLGGNGTGDQGNAGSLPGVPRLGIPESKMYDGPAGVLSLYDTTNPPIEQMLASTWDTDLAYDYGKIHGSENKAIGGNMQLGSQIDITRNPYFGRAKDQMGEDPYLLSDLAASETKGIQDQNVMTVLKHFAAFAQDANPSTNTNVNISEQALHEIYLPAFEAAVKAGATGVMSSYNMINGAFASSNEYLQLDVLRDMWNFKGFTITDWGGNDGFTLNKGTDIEMPNVNSNSQEAAEGKIEAGEITQETIDEAVCHVLYAYAKTGYLGLVELDENGNVKEEKGRTEPIKLAADTEKLAEVREENSLIARQVAEEGAVLLKNENEALPLNTDDDKTVAVIGLNGMNLISGVGGERSYGTISKMTSPYEELASRLGEDKVEGQVAMDIVGEAIPADVLYLDAEGSDKGVKRTYGIAGNEGSASDQQGQMKMSGNQEATPMGDHEIGEDTGIIDSTIDFTTGTIDGKPNKTYKADGADEGTATAFTKESGAVYTWTTYLEAPEDGEYSLILEGIGGTAAANIELAEDNTASLGIANINQGTQWPADSYINTETGMSIVSHNAGLEAGKRYKITVTAAATLEEKDLQVRLAWITPSQKTANYENALKAAENNDTVVVFAYNKGESIAETLEETTCALDAEQEKLILDAAEAAHANGNKVVVVLNNDTAVTMGNWIDKVDGVLEMYFPGQEGGAATAELLTGEINPSGKLAYAIPKEDTDTMVTCSQEAFDSQDIEEPGAPYAEETYEKEVKMGRYASVEEAKEAMGETRTNHTADYSEGIYTGYRWYDENGIDPLYDFGYGLSYTTFSYSDITVEENAAEGESAGYDVTFTVTNTGDTAGSETAQIYLGEAEVPEDIQMAKYQLCGYEKIKNLEPGESRTVTVHVNERSLSYWDTDAELQEEEDGTSGKWTLATGKRTIYVGSSSDNLLLENEIEVGM
ncbi:MAG: glycoside hydrolase family 3 N-terminal domain-containing protein [Eubacteriales bacterium]|nr:glycoside hydrolase family 3 N-terminal domain-containing protein [Eubacteriales bacterium]